MYDKTQELKKTYTSLEQKSRDSNLSSLEMKTAPFEGRSILELEMNKEPEDYKVKIDKAGVICVFYICHLPFVQC